MASRTTAVAAQVTVGVRPNVCELAPARTGPRGATACERKPLPLCTRPWSCGGVMRICVAEMTTVITGPAAVARASRGAAAQVARTVANPSSAPATTAVEQAMLGPRRQTSCHRRCDERAHQCAGPQGGGLYTDAEVARSGVLGRGDDDDQEPVEDQVEHGRAERAIAQERRAPQEAEPFDRGFHGGLVLAPGAGARGQQGDAADRHQVGAGIGGEHPGGIHPEEDAARQWPRDHRDTRAALNQSQRSGNQVGVDEVAYGHVLRRSECAADRAQQKRGHEKSVCPGGVGGFQDGECPEHERADGVAGQEQRPAFVPVREDPGGQPRQNDSEGQCGADESRLADVSAVVSTSSEPMRWSPTPCRNH